MSRDFISHRLPDIRKASPNTVKAYREGLNKFIDYLEDVKQIPVPVCLLNILLKETLQTSLIGC